MLDSDLGSKLVELEQLPLLMVDDILVTSDSRNKTEVAQIFSQLLNPKLDPTFTVIGNSNSDIGDIPVYAARNPLLPPNSEEERTS